MVAMVVSAIYSTRNCMEPFTSPCINPLVHAGEIQLTPMRVVAPVGGEVVFAGLAFVVKMDTW